MTVQAEFQTEVIDDFFLNPFIPNKPRSFKCKYTFKISVPNDLWTFTAKRG